MKGRQRLGLKGQKLTHGHQTYKASSRPRPAEYLPKSINPARGKQAKPPTPLNAVLPKKPESL